MTTTAADKSADRAAKDGLTMQQDAELGVWLLPKELLAKIRTFASSKKRSQCDVVTEALEHYLAVKRSR